MPKRSAITIIIVLGVWLALTGDTAAQTECADRAANVTTATTALSKLAALDVNACLGGAKCTSDVCTRAMKAIAHPLRLKILCLLNNGEVAVQEIVEAVGTTQSNISQHLAILRDKKILKTRKDANKVYYRIADARILHLVSMMREVFCGVPPKA